MDCEEFCKALRDIATVMHLTQLTLPSLVGDSFTVRLDATQGLLYHVMKCLEITSRLEHCNDWAIFNRS